MSVSCAASCSISGLVSAGFPCPRRLLGAVVVVLAPGSPGETLFEWVRPSLSSVWPRISLPVTTLWLFLAALTKLSPGTSSTLSLGAKLLSEEVLGKSRCSTREQAQLCPLPKILGGFLVPSRAQQLPSDGGDDLSVLLSGFRQAESGLEEANLWAAGRNNPSWLQNDPGEAVGVLCLLRAPSCPRPAFFVRSRGALRAESLLPRGTSWGFAALSVDSRLQPGGSF